MTDESKAAILLLKWFAAFTAGLMIADKFSRPVGLIIAACSVLVLAVYLRTDGRIEAEKKRREKYAADCAKRMEEVLKNDED
jgi:hypothetical protein